LLFLAAAVLATPGWADAVNDSGAVILPREIMGDEADARLYEACTDLATNDPNAAFDQALEWRYEGGGPPAWHCAGLALVALGFHAEAGEVFERMARDMPPGYGALQAEVLGQAGQAWLRGGEPGRAVAVLDAALHIDARNPELLIDRAQALAAQGGFWEAIDDLSRAIELTATPGEAYGFRAAAYRHVGSLELAADDIARATALRPDDPVLLLERGNIRRLTGDDAGARGDWLRVVMEAPGTLAAQSAQTNLERLDVNIE
jgi:tetratricopeptide (TPR) repeat protein